MAAFSVRRCKPVLVSPAEPTPHEFKRLSDIDLQEAQRSLIGGIWFYPANPAMRGEDPAGVIRDALSRALVYYYPFAGRLREGPGRRLAVECTGEGVLFTEADAGIRLDQFEGLQPPFPYVDELLCNVQGRAGGILDSPLLLVQVTRLMCGGFVMGIRHNHVIADASGLIQLLKATGELARGAPCPSLIPVWRRELLAARDPPAVTCVHHEFDETEKRLEQQGDSVLRSFFFLPSHVAGLRDRLPEDLRVAATTFDVLTAYIWRCRTAALHLGPEEKVRALCIMTAHGRFPNLVPDGYYGNSYAHPAAVSTAGELCGSPFEYAFRLVKEAKSKMTEEYMRSAADLSALRGWTSPVASLGTMIVSDLRRVGFREVDLGWGWPVFASAADASDRVSCYTANREPRSGEEGILVSIRLPTPAMQRFAREMESMTRAEELSATTSLACEPGLPLVNGSVSPVNGEMAPTIAAV